MNKYILSLFVFSILFFGFNNQVVRAETSSPNSTKAAVINNVCCESFGYGSKMVKTSSTYTMMPRAQCSVCVSDSDTGIDKCIVGGGRNIVDESFCNSRVCTGDTAIVCENGTTSQSYIDKDGCKKFKCVLSKSSLVCPSGCSCSEKTTICSTTDKPIVETEIFGNKNINIEKEGFKDDGPNSSKIFMSKTVSAGEILIKSSSVSSSSVKEGASEEVKINQKGVPTTVSDDGIGVTTMEKVSVVNSKLTMETSSGKSKTIEIMPEQITKILDIDFVKKAELVQESEKPVYVVNGNKEGKILWVFRKNQNSESKIDAETGKVISVEKPWWNFMFR